MSHISYDIVVLILYLDNVGFSLGVLSRNAGMVDVVTLQISLFVCLGFSLWLFFHSVSAPGGSVISQVRTQAIFANVVVCGRWRSLRGGLLACLDVQLQGA